MLSICDLRVQRGRDGRVQRPHTPRRKRHAKRWLQRRHILRPGRWQRCHLHCLEGSPLLRSSFGGKSRPVVRRRRYGVVLRVHRLSNMRNRLLHSRRHLVTWAVWYGHEETGLHSYSGWIMSLAVAATVRLLPHRITVRGRGMSGTASSVVDGRNNDAG